jgi:hypothetical protein
MSPRNELEEWLTELPPLDGGEDEPDENEGAGDDFVPDEGDDTSLDDAVADDLDVDEGVEITEEEPVSKDDDQWQADVGEPELDLTEGESAADGDASEAPSEGDGELDIDEDLPASDDDAGEEGTMDPIEHSLDEELPALDADDEGDFEDALMLEVTAPSVSSASPRWADALWEERAGLSRKLDGPLEEDDEVVGVSLALASVQEVVARATERGLVLISTVDGPGRTMRGPADGRGRYFFAFSGTGHPILWAANAAGELARSADFGATWTRSTGLGRLVLAIGTRDDGALSVLARKADAIELMTSTDGTRWFTQRISVELQGDETRTFWLAHRGSAAAIGDAGGVSISRDGRHFTRIAASSGATAGAFVGRSPDAPLVLAGTFESEEAIHLLRVSRDGTAEIVGEMTPPNLNDEDPKVLSMVWHEATETLRVAFATHLVTWGPTRKSFV